MFAAGPAAIRSPSSRFTVWPQWRTRRTINKEPTRAERATTDVELEAKDETVIRHYSWLPRLANGRDPLSIGQRITKPEILGRR